MTVQAQLQAARRKVENQRLQLNQQSAKRAPPKPKAKTGPRPNPRRQPLGPRRPNPPRQRRPDGTQPLAAAMSPKLSPAQSEQAKGIATWNPLVQTPVPQLAGVGKSLNTPLKVQHTTRSLGDKPTHSVGVYPVDSVPIPGTDTTAWYRMPGVSTDCTDLDESKYQPYGPRLIVLSSTPTAVAGWIVNKVEYPLDSRHNNEPFGGNNPTLEFLESDSPGPTKITKEMLIPYALKQQVNSTEITFPRLEGAAQASNMPVNMKPGRFGFSLRNIQALIKQGGTIRHLRLTSGVSLAEIGIVPEGISYHDPVLQEDIQIPDWDRQKASFDKYCEEIKSTGDIVSMTGQHFRDTQCAYSIPVNQTTYGQYSSHIAKAESQGTLTGMQFGSARRRRTRVKHEYIHPNVNGWKANSSTGHSQILQGVTYTIGPGQWTIESAQPDLTALHNDSSMDLVVSDGQYVTYIDSVVWNTYVAAGLLTPYAAHIPITIPLSRRIDFPVPAPFFPVVPSANFTFDEADNDWKDYSSTELFEKLEKSLAEPSMSIHLILVEPYGSSEPSATETLTGGEAPFVAVSSDTPEELKDQNILEFSISRQDFARHDASSLLHSVAVDQPTAPPNVINSMRDVGEKSASFMHSAADAAQAILGVGKMAFKAISSVGPVARTIAGLFI